MPKHRTWLLLRGLVREQRHWGNFPAVLQSYCPDDKIILYDFPGNGHRHEESSLTSITEMVEDARFFLTDQPVQQPVHIIALSLGGMVAVEWMSRYPEESAGTILISTSLRGLNPFYQRLLPSSYPAIFKSLFFPGDIYDHETRNMQLVSNIVANDAIKREVVIDHWVNYAKQFPVTGMNGLRQLLAATRFSVPTVRPVTPVLILRSLADQMVSPECSLTLSNYWDLPIETHDTSGHDIPLDDSAWVCKKINHWLRNNF